jgi:putative membrane protein
MTFIIGLILGAATLIFVFQNMMAVTVNFLGWQMEGNLAVILALSVLIGMIISWLLSLPQALRLSDLSRSNRKLVKELDEKKMKLSETEGKLSQAETPVIVQKTVITDTKQTL